MSDDKKQMMTEFWSERARHFGDDPRANTNDVWLREVEIGYFNNLLQSSHYPLVMDFGCANGYSTSRIAEENQTSCFIGVDINNEMLRIATARCDPARTPNLQFRHLDVLTEAIDERFDLIYAIRAFQNLESFHVQKRIANRLIDLLHPGGALAYIESYVDGYSELNRDRIKMALPPLPIHPHLTLLTGAFDEYLSERMRLVKQDSPSSTYYLVTRLIYSYIARTNGEPIDYNHPLHQVAAMVPQIGEYGPQRAAVYRKR